MSTDRATPSESSPAEVPPISSRLVRVVTAVAALVLAARLIQSYSGPLINPDTYFHLRFGDEFAHSWRPWHVGSLDAYSNASWVPTQWLSELGMYRVDQWFGLPGVAVLATAAVTALLVTWYAAARRWCDPLPALLLTVTGVLVAGSSLSARPQVLSYILATITAVAWMRAQTASRMPWWLVPLTWVWAMVHGMWILGAIVSIVAGCTLVATRRMPARALLVGIGSLLVGALTPAGPRLITAVLTVNSRATYFAEWTTPKFTSVAGAAALVLLASMVVLLARAEQKADAFALAMTSLAAAFTVYSLRTLPVGTCIMIPLLAPYLQRAIGPRSRARRGEICYVTGIALMIVLGTALIAPHRADAPPAYTHAFDTELAALPPQTPVLSESQDGGPLMWTHPELDFPVHGYADVYTDQELARFADLLSLQPKWDRTLHDLGIRHALLPSDSALAYALVLSGWHIDATGADHELLSAS